MHEARPLCLLLAMLLAFWTPVSDCCAAMGEADAPSAAAIGEALPPCHAPAGPAAPDERRDPCHQPGDAEPCDCPAVARSLCNADQADPVATVNTASHPTLPAPAMTALPTTLLPHTFFTARTSRDHDDARPARAPRSLVALACQLTL